MILKETIIQILNLEKESEEEQIKILEEVSGIVLDKALLRLMDEMSEEEAMQINDFLDNGKQEEVALFLYKKFPNINDIFDEEIENIKEELVKQNGK